MIESDELWLLDLYCSAGGCTKGYQRAGFCVVGVDINPQPRYCGDAFVQMDAIKALETLLCGEHITDSNGKQWRLSDFIAVHASPPCQAYSVTKSLTTKKHPELIEQTRELLKALGKPYVIENVPGAPLDMPLKLNGHHFGLKVIRERWFETIPWMLSPGYVKPKTNTCPRGVFSSFGNGATHITVAGHNFKVDDARVAMQIDWMNQHELAQAIPPVYTEWIGQRLIENLRS